jgi:hypothetical protein
MRRVTSLGISARTQTDTSETTRATPRDASGAPAASGFAARTVSRDGKERPAPPPLSRSESNRAKSHMKSRGGTMAKSVRDATTENPRSIGQSASVVEAARLMLGTSSVLSPTMTSTRRSNSWPATKFGGCPLSRTAGSSASLPRPTSPSGRTRRPVSSSRRSLSPQRESAGSVARTARLDDRCRDGRSRLTRSFTLRGRCSECVRGRLPLPEALRDELGPLLLAPAVQHLEV